MTAGCLLLISVEHCFPTFIILVIVDDCILMLLSDYQSLVDFDILSCHIIFTSYCPLFEVKHDKLLKFNYRSQWFRLSGSSLLFIYILWAWFCCFLSDHYWCGITLWVCTFISSWDGYNTLIITGQADFWSEMTFLCYFHAYNCEKW